MSFFHFQNKIPSYNQIEDSFDSLLNPFSLHSTDLPQDEPKINTITSQFFQTESSTKGLVAPSYLNDLPSQRIHTHYFSIISGKRGFRMRELCQNNCSSHFTVAQIIISRMRSEAFYYSY